MHSNDSASHKVERAPCHPSKNELNNKNTLLKRRYVGDRYSGTVYPGNTCVLSSDFL